MPGRSAPVAGCGFWTPDVCVTRTGWLRHLDFAFCAADQHHIPCAVRVALSSFLPKANRGLPHTFNGTDAQHAHAQPCDAPVRCRCAFLVYHSCGFRAASTFHQVAFGLVPTSTPPRTCLRCFPDTRFTLRVCYTGCYTFRARRPDGSRALCTDRHHTGLYPRTAFALPRLPDLNHTICLDTFYRVSFIPSGLERCRVPAGCGSFVYTTAAHITVAYLPRAFCLPSAARCGHHNVCCIHARLTPRTHALPCRRTNVRRAPPAHLPAVCARLPRFVHYVWRGLARFFPPRALVFYGSCAFAAPPTRGGAVPPSHAFALPFAVSLPFYRGLPRLPTRFSVQRHASHTTVCLLVPSYVIPHWTVPTRFARVHALRCGGYLFAFEQPTVSPHVPFLPLVRATLLHAVYAFVVRLYI